MPAKQLFDPAVEGLAARFANDKTFTKLRHAMVNVTKSHGVERPGNSEFVRHMQGEGIHADIGRRSGQVTAKGVTPRRGRQADVGILDKDVVKGKVDF